MDKSQVKGQKLKIEELEEKLQLLEDQLKRALADYQNLEKRIQDGRSELTSFVGANLISKLLPVLDHLEMALLGATDQERQSGWFKGVDLSVAQFKQILKEEGVDQIVADGQFDPSLHEAVDIREGEDNKILEVVQKGYTLNGRVLKPARVVVGKSAAAKAPANEEGEN